MWVVTLVENPDHNGTPTFREEFVPKVLDTENALLLADVVARKGGKTTVRRVSRFGLRLIRSNEEMKR
jgi:hypothetical protein